MSIVMKNKLSAAALAIATIMGMGYSSLASAATANFTSEVTIASPLDCPVLLETPEGTNWAVTWTLTNATDASGVLTYTQIPQDPLTITVRYDVGNAPSCDLSGVKLKADSSVAVSPASASFYDQTTSNGGLWRYAPVLSKVTMYTDDAGTAAIDTGANALTVTDANGATHTQQATAQYTAQAALTPITDMGSLDAVSLSNNYLDSNAYVPLAGGAETSTSLQTPTQVRAVDFGVSAIMANNPIDQAGAVDVQAVNNTDVVSLPFTINVEYH